MTNIAKETVEATISTLVQQREKWENGTYAASKIELYAILAQCLKIYQQAVKDPNTTDAIKDLLKSRGLKGNSGTSLETKVVRIVFATAANYTKIKQRLYTYARAISVAHDEKQTPETLATFITEKGGIDEIRRASSKTLENSPEAIQRIAQIEFEKPDHPCLYSDFELDAALMPENGERYALALVRRNEDGRGSIIFGTNKLSIVNSVLLEAGKAFKGNAEKTAVVNLHQKAEDQKQANMDALKQSVRQRSASADAQAKQDPAQLVLA